MALFAALTACWENRMLYETLYLKDSKIEKGIFHPNSK